MRTIGIGGGLFMAMTMAGLAQSAGTHGDRPAVVRTNPPTKAPARTDTFTAKRKAKAETARRRK